MLSLKCNRLFFVSVFSFVAILALSGSSFASTIAGFVYNSQRAPIDRVDVELLNENYSTLLRTKTNSVGRYQFGGVPDGRFYVRVLPFRFNFEDQTQEVIVQTISLLGSGNGNFEKDFYLNRKKGELGDTTTGVVFAQEVPKAAEELFKQALKDISGKNPTDGMKKLVGALKIFPSYYAASQRLGIELLKNKQYLEATKFFMNAAEANPKSSRSMYYMGFALNKLGRKYNKAALKALEKAKILAPNNWEVAYLRGKIERQEGNYSEAERYLLKSKRLANTRKPAIHIELAQLYGNDLKRYDRAADELELYLKSSKKKDKKIKKQIAELRSKAKRSSS